MVITVTPTVDSVYVCDYPSGCAGTAYGATTAFDVELMAIVDADSLAAVTNVTWFSDLVARRATRDGELTAAKIADARAEAGTMINTLLANIGTELLGDVEQETLIALTNTQIDAEATADERLAAVGFAL